MDDSYNLLQEIESEWLDFKQEFHQNNAELVHDIISLANSKAYEDRYLIFGVVEKEGKVVNIVGIENDPNRKQLQQINNLLYNSNFNRIPEIDLTEIIVEEHKVAILKIKNSSLKPYFLLSDKRDGNVTVRAGVAYSRLGDSNTPINGSPKDDDFERMWRERFNLNLKPIERFSYLLDDPDQWVQKKESELYHSQFPEFIIREVEDPGSKYKEPIEKWMQGFPDPSLSTYYMNFIYQGTQLESFLCAYLDGARYFVPFPERKTFKIDDKYYTIYYLIKNSLKHKLLILTANKYNNYDRRIVISKYYHIVNSEDELDLSVHAHQTWKKQIKSQEA